MNFQFRKLWLVELFVHLAVITFLVLVTARPVAAQTPTVATVIAKEGTEGAKMEAATDAAKKKSNYQIVYPGLLPDHPLYFLKSLRDRIVDFLIADSLKKAEFSLSQADKHLAYAAAFVDKGNDQQAKSMADREQAYLSRIFAEVEKARGEGKHVIDFTEKLKDALRKHEEVLGELAEKTSGPLKDQFFSIAKDVAQKRSTL